MVAEASATQHGLEHHPIALNRTCRMGSSGGGGDKTIQGCRNSVCVMLSDFREEMLSWCLRWGGKNCVLLSQASRVLRGNPDHPCKLQLSARVLIQREEMPPHLHKLPNRGDAQGSGWGGASPGGRAGWGFGVMDKSKVSWGHQLGYHEGGGIVHVVVHRPKLLSFIRCQIQFLGDESNF